MTASLLGVFFEIFVGIALFFVLTWVAIFGGIGALLSHTRNGSALEGFGFGALLGPIGWVLIWFRTRATAGESLEDVDTTQDGWSTL